MSEELHVILVVVNGTCLEKQKMFYEASSYIGKKLIHIHY